MENAKPGWKTTEFWLTLLSNVPAVLAVFGVASNPIGMAVGAAATIGYAISRSSHKSAVAQAAALACVQAAADAAKSEAGKG